MIHFNPRNISRRFKAELSLTPLLAGFLAACGDGASTSDFFITTPPTDLDPTTPEADPFYVRVIDGPIWGATVYIDENNNQQYDAGEQEIGKTDEQGRVAVEEAYQDSSFIAVLTNAYDVNTGQYHNSGTVYYASEATRGYQPDNTIVLTPVVSLFSELKARNEALPSDQQLTDAEILQRIFGSDTDVQVDDIFNSEFYSWDGTAGDKGSTDDRMQEVTERAIQLQQAVEHDYGDDFAALADDHIGDLTEENSFEPSETSFTAQQNAEEAIEQTQQSQTGQPNALPAIGLNFDEDTSITISQSDWGFADPGGNSDGSASSLSGVRLTHIRFDGQAAGDQLGAFYDGNGNLLDLRTLIAADGVSLPSPFTLQYVPRADDYGTVHITYVVIDNQGEESEPAELVLTINPVAEPRSLEIGGDASFTGLMENVENEGSAGHIVQVNNFDGTVADDQFTVYEADGSVSTRFEVRGTTLTYLGVVGGIDHETEANIELRIDHDAGDGSEVVSAQVTVAITDVSEAGPVVTSPTEITLKEGIYSVPYALHEIQAEADIASETGSLQWSILNNAGGVFSSYNTVGGVGDPPLVADSIRIHARNDMGGRDDGIRTFDYETGPTSYTLTIRVTDSAGRETEFDVTVNIEDVNEGPVIDQKNGDVPLYFDHIDTAGSALTSFTASDEDAGDTQTWTLSGADAGLFTIDENTGVVTWAAAPDFGVTKSDAGTDVFELLVTVTDAGGLSDSVAVHVSLFDTTPIELISGQSAAPIAENTDLAMGSRLYVAEADAGNAATLSYAFADGGDFGGRLQISISGVVTWAQDYSTDHETDEAITFTITVTNSATDVDVGTTLAWSLSDGDAALFQINDNGIITWRTAPTFSATPSENIYTFNAEVTDGELTDTIAVTVTVLEEVPIALASATTLSAVSESTGLAAGPLYTAMANYEGDSSDISYTITDSTIAGLFIHADTGVVTLANPQALDHETSETETFTITATHGASGVSRDFIITIPVTDAEDNPPEITSEHTDFSVNEGVAIAAGSLLEHFEATPDIEGDGISWSLSDNPSGLFTIDASGDLRLATDLTPDFEMAAQYSVTVQAQTNSGAIMTQVITLNVNDVNEAPSINEVGPLSIDLLEGSQSVTALTASHADINDPITWSLTGPDAGLFTIDNNGVITWENPPNDQTMSNANSRVFSITAIATDSGLQGAATSLSDAIDIQINLFDQTPIVLNSEPTATPINENELVTSGRVIYTIDASHSSGSMVSYQLLQAGPGALTINGNQVVWSGADRVFDHEADAAFQFTLRTSAANGLVSRDFTITVPIVDLEETPPVLVRVPDNPNDPNNPFNNGDATSITLEEGGTIGDVMAIYATTHDVDIDGLSYALTDPTGAFEFDPATGELRLADPDLLSAMATSNFEITITVTTDSGGTATQTLDVTVTEVNLAPTIIEGDDPISVNTPDGQTTVTMLSGADQNLNDVFSWSLADSGDFALFTIDPNTGAISWNNPPRYEASNPDDNVYTIIAVLSDGQLTDSIEVQVNVTAPPAFSLRDGNAANPVDEYTTTRANQPLYRTQATFIADPSVTSISYSFTTTLNQNFNGIELRMLSGDAVLVTTTDWGGFSHDATPTVAIGTLTVSAAVNGVTHTQDFQITLPINDLNNQPPVISGDDEIVVDENTTINAGTTLLTLSAEPDIEGGNVIWSVTSDPFNDLTIDANGNLSFASNQTFDHELQTSYTIVVQADAGDGQTATHTITLRVNDVNEGAPVITQGDTSLDIDAMVGDTTVTTITASDPDINDVLQWYLTGDDANDFTITNGVITWNTAPESRDVSRNGDNVFEITAIVSDVDGREDMIDVSITLM